MHTNHRIFSILQTPILPQEITSFPEFSPSWDELTDLKFKLPNNLRLGQLVEHAVGQLLKESSNYNVLHQGLQIKDGKVTIGELDFILQETKSSEIIHLELAYKFYLFDPTISRIEKENWIGPNRKDTLVEKLQKLQTKQLPLLFHPLTVQTLAPLAVNTVKQQLCLLANLYLPYQFKEEVLEVYQPAIKGYYMNWNQFQMEKHTGKSYHLPEKKEWGIRPEFNDNWMEFHELHPRLERSMQETRSQLIWQQEGNKYSEFFVTWWG